MAYWLTRLSASTCKRLPRSGVSHRPFYAALGLGVTPLAMVEALGTEAYNSLNNASLAGQYWARGEMAANTSDANVARLQAAPQ